MQQFVFVDSDRRWLPATARIKERGFSLTVLYAAWHMEFGETWRNIADRLIVFSDASAEGLTERLAQENERQHIRGLLCDQDALIHQISFACEQIAIPFTRHAGVTLARSKLATRNLLARHGYLGPRFVAVPALSNLPREVAQVGFPCVVKPSSGSGSRLCYPVYCEEHIAWYQEEAERVRAKAPDYMQWVFADGYICEELLEGPVLSVAVAAWEGQYTPVSVALHLMQEVNPCMGFGSILPIDRKLENAQEIGRYAAQVCCLMDLELGFFDVELVLSKRGPVLLEVNPRPMGGEMVAAFSTATGVSLHELIVDIYSRESPRTPRRARDDQAVVYKLTSAADAVVSNHLTATLLEDLVPRDVTFRNYRLYPGRAVRELEVLGRLVNSTSDPEAEFERLRRVGLAMAAAAGVDVVEGWIPRLDSPPDCDELGAVTSLSP